MPSCRYFRPQEHSLLICSVQPQYTPANDEVVVMFFSGSKRGGLDLADDLFEDPHEVVSGDQANLMV